MDRSESPENRINRRQYLTVLAAGGTTTMVPATAIADTAAGDSELFRETIDDGGATATVSETGEIIAFGVYGGTTRAYMAEDGENDQYDAVELALPGVSRGTSVSHGAVTEETNDVIAAAMNDDIFGGGNLDDASSWFGTPSTDAEWDMRSRDCGRLERQPTCQQSLP